MKGERGGFRMLRHEQLLKELVHDSYKLKTKLESGTRCLECGAVYEHGRWRWDHDGPEDGPTTLCPACHRIRDGMPAGYVQMSGPFVREHRDEIEKRVRRCETLERREHPLERIMKIEPGADGMLVTTTDTHLARRIGEALHDSFKGEVQYHYNKEDNLLRVTWSRP